MPLITVKSKKRCEFIDITPDVNALIPKSFNSGSCHVFALHTTAGITINENADQDVVNDILEYLEDIIPHLKRKYSHMEGNSDAHIKSSLIGVSQIIPVKNGKLCLGTWQGIFFCEFDGPRTRHIEVNFWGNNY
ncbi:MAG TPA: secondary thiamine-phosphate synthase enzyme YjbQ [Victivallales bacterium]|nr:secondary thiamine-phosphate synthase enzyme YjbQ [Victivallales bacterium]HPO89734.1 secondary thiamine-phosphate synthase enzyme YjbQ [Victivallales bacterium]HRU00113.1 secondary thiamine-phosphate synthase enzyme YjbQ [Victivallales bacterium]